MEDSTPITEKHPLFGHDIKELDAIEGGYVNDPDDPGGETFRGVSREYHPDWEGWKVVDEAKTSEGEFCPSKEQAKKLNEWADRFYFNNYWDPLGLGSEIFDGMDKVRLHLFLVGVHKGPGTATEHLQRALNCLNRDEKDFEDLRTDGMMGPKTKGALRAYKGTRSWSTRSKEAVEEVLLTALKGYLFRDYLEALKKNPTLEKYFFGWLLQRT